MAMGGVGAQADVRSGEWEQKWCLTRKMIMNNKLPYVQDVKELRVYQLAYRCSMDLFSLSALFPKEERYALTDQLRRSGRSVCANMSEAWGKRIYEAHFVSKISDAECEAREINCYYHEPKESQ